MSRIFNAKNVFIALLVLWTLFVIQFGILIMKLRNSPHEYSSFLTYTFLWSCGGSFLLVVAFLLVGFIFFKKFDYECIENWMIIVWTIFIVAGLIWLQYQIQIFKKDIQNGDYVVYSGNFEKSVTKGFVFLEDDLSTRLHNTNDTFLEPGYYSGEIVYSRRTKYILSYALNSGESSSVS